MSTSFNVPEQPPDCWHAMVMVVALVALVALVVV
jgi:hypothetical protein